MQDSRGKTLFFPLINYVTFRGDGSRESCMSLMSRAARLTDAPSALILEIGGSVKDKLIAHRQATRGCFKVEEAEIDAAAGNGYYVAIEPLPPGMHVLNFGGILPTMSQAVTYTLIVE